MANSRTSSSWLLPGWDSSSTRVENPSSARYASSATTAVGTASNAVDSSRFANMNMNRVDRMMGKMSAHTASSVFRVSTASAPLNAFHMALKALPVISRNTSFSVGGSA